MSSRFNAEAAVLAADLLYQYGESVVLDRGLGRTADLTGIVSPEKPVERVDEQGIKILRTCSVKVPEDELGDVPAKCRMIVREVAWHIEGIGEARGGLIELSLIREETAERSKPEYRK